jgi:hypothetical protein
MKIEKYWKVREVTGDEYFFIVIQNFTILFQIKAYMFDKLNYFVLILHNTKYKLNVPWEHLFPRSHKE